MSGSRLEGRIALVTGANHGIGAATARALAAEGAGVFVSSFRKPPRFDEAGRAAALAAGIGGPELYEARQQQDPGLVVAAIAAHMEMNNNRLFMFGLLNVLR